MTITDDMDHVAIKPANAPYFTPLRVTISSVRFLLLFLPLFFAIENIRDILKDEDEYKIFS
jgi:hypothetical protein